MQAHTKIYTYTFIKIADDCPITSSEIPSQKGDTKTVVNIQFELISKNPYKFTSDDVLLQVFADRNGLTKSEYKAQRAKFLPKGQSCF